MEYSRNQNIIEMARDIIYELQQCDETYFINMITGAIMYCEEIEDIEYEKRLKEIINKIKCV